MNIEVEIKVKMDSIDTPKSNLLERGELVKKIEQIDEYYVPCHRDFFAQKPFPVEWLRIRKNPDKTLFEYDKSVNKDAKGEQEYAEEYETEVSSPEELKKILQFLDFKKIVTVKKKREVWDCGSIEISLDEVDGLGFFVEAEAKGEFQNSKEAKEACYRFLKEIGVSPGPENIINAGYPVLLLEKRKQTS